MTPDDQREELQQALNPHRDEERDRNANEIALRLRDRLIDVEGDEDPGELATLMEAVELFEAAVELRGGDLMVDSPRSSRPETPGFVLPPRHADESLRAYALRVRDAADVIEPTAGSRTPPGDMPGMESDADLQE
jgi:hypothetical protein